MLDDKMDVFATPDCKLVLRKRWDAQTLHRHRPIELIAALDGPIELRTQTGLQRSSCFLVPPMREHALGRYAGRVVRIYLDPGYRHLASWKTLPIATEKPGHVALLAQIEAFYRSRRSAEAAARLIAIWLDQWCGAVSPGVPCDPRVTAVLQHLDQQTNPVQADRRSMARLVGLSPTRFAALFADNTGMPLSRYLIWRRVKAAMALICAGESVTRAAAQAGFADGAHLTRSCRMTYGCTPSSFANTKLTLLPGTILDPTAACAEPEPDGAATPHVCLAPLLGPGTLATLDPAASDG